MSERLGVIFPGQGAQVVGMGKDLVESFPVARRIFDDASRLLDFDLARIAFEGPEAELNRTDVAQPAILVHSIAALEVMAERGIGRSRGRHAGVSFTAGLSLGEYTALVFAGALDFADAVRLVRRRGVLMQEASMRVPSTMVATRGLTREQAEELCARARGSDVLQVANLNAPGQVVVAGDVVACERLEALAKAEGLGATVRLPVAGAFHSQRMLPAAEGLARALAAVEVRAPRIPFVSNVTARYESDPAQIKALLARQLTSPVEWQASIERALADGVREFEEVGPGKVLAGLARKIDRTASVASFGTAAQMSVAAGGGGQG